MMKRKWKGKQLPKNIIYDPALGLLRVDVKEKGSYVPHFLGYFDNLENALEAKKQYKSFMQILRVLRYRKTKI